jgi:hypothetical protein
MPDLADLTLDHRLALRSAAAKLHDEFDGVFGAETIELFLTTSYDRVARRARFPTYVALFAERFARQRLRALAKVDGRITDTTPVVLFLCVHNAGRSQMALGWCNRLAGDRAVAWSGGSEPGIEVNPGAIEAPRSASTSPVSSQTVDRRDRGGRRCRGHHGLRGRLPVVSGQTSPRLGPR